jgi:hypothetical protein
MARYSENECAWCAEEMTSPASEVGQDQKIYCGKACRLAGERASRRELQQLMRYTSERHTERKTDTALYSLPR